MANKKRPFSFVDMPPGRTSTKPRRKGLTLMTDFGLGIERVRDMLELSSDYLDIAKIATGSSRLYEESKLIEKLALYKQYRVRPYLGGQFQEYVFANYGIAMLERFLKEAYRLGFEAAEVSDNYVGLTPQERRDQLKLVVDCGLAAFGEVGAKPDFAKGEAPASDPAILIAQVNDVLMAGAEIALLEGAELFTNHRLNDELFSAIRNELDTSRIFFEVPSHRVGSSWVDAHNLKKMLVREFGPDVNIANVHHDDIIETEALRIGMGVVGPAGRKVSADK